MYHFLVLKLIVLIIVFLFSFFLYIFKIIGGADGKLFIILFMNHPLIYLNYFFINIFYLLFSIGFILIHLIQILLNKKSGYDIFFIFVNKNSLSLSKFKNLFLKAFYKFSSIKILEENNNNNKGVINSNYLIYNPKRREFQILVQNRIPIILILAIAYVLIIILQVI